MYNDEKINYLYCLFNRKHAALLRAGKFSKFGLFRKDRCSGLPRNQQQQRQQQLWQLIHPKKQQPRSRSMVYPSRH